MKKLYTPIVINKTEFKNRVCMAPMGLGTTDYVDGNVTDRLIDCYVQRAKGGVGMIDIANIMYDPNHLDPVNGPILTDDKYIPSLKKLTDALHEAGSKVVAQLVHMGRYQFADFCGGEAIAPSVTTSRYNGYQVPRAMTTQEVKDMVVYQAQAAERAKRAGFDAVEIQTNSGYLHGQFWSPLTNLRTDEYGGSFENRIRFTKETLYAVRKAVGPDFPIIIRLSGTDFVKGSCDHNDIANICEALDKTGTLDAISVTAGWHESSVPLVTMELENATYAYLGKNIKKRVSCVVMQGMRMNIPTAETVVERGDVDMAVIGRPLLCDPELVNKGMAGRYDEIRPCIGCNAGCLDAGIKREVIGCISNYECNRELVLRDENGKLPTEVKSAHPEKILVIGAGPAGMEFARVATLRGHKVTIWEKRNRTIGLSEYAATPPRRGEIRKIGQWLERTIRAMGVEIVLNKEATAENVLEAAKSFDRVVFANGSKAVLPPIPTKEGAHVVHAWDVLDAKGKLKLGKNVVVVGGGDVGVETALYVAEVGTISAEQIKFHIMWDAAPIEQIKEMLNHGYHNVSVVEMGKKLAPDINPGCRWSIMARCRQLGVQMYKLTKVLEIRPDCVVIENSDGVKELPADSVIIAAGARPDQDVYNAVKDKLPKVDIIGDAVEVARIPNSVRDGYLLAASI